MYNLQYKMFLLNGGWNGAFGFRPVFTIQNVSIKLLSISFKDIPFSSIYNTKCFY